MYHHRDDVSLLDDGSDEEGWYHSPASHHNQRAAESAILHHAHYLAHPWDDLHLGSHLGTPALNEYLREQLRASTVSSGYSRRQSVPQFTAQQCLPMIESLRVSTVLPPPKSELHAVVQQNTSGEKSKGDGEEYMEVSVDMEEEEETTAYAGDRENPASTQFFYGPKIPHESLARLYESMCAQDVDDGREAQRQAQFLTSDACIDRLRGMEDTILDLRMREQRVIQTARTVGLMPKDNPAGNVEVNRLLGAIWRDSNHSSDNDNS